MVADDEWDISMLIAEYAGISALLVKKSELVLNFSDTGQLFGMVEFLVTGGSEVITGVYNLQNLMRC